MSEIRKDFNKAFPFIIHHDYSHSDLIEAAKWMAEILCNRADETISITSDDIRKLAQELDHE